LAAGHRKLLPLHRRAVMKLRETGEERLFSEQIPPEQDASEPERVSGLLLVIERADDGVIRDEALGGEALADSKLHHGSVRHPSNEFAELFARLETDRVSGRDRDLDAGLRIAADASLAPLDLEDAEAAQLDAVSGAERGTHRFDDRFDRCGGLGAR